MSNWIKCSERMPDKGSPVLFVATLLSEHRIICMGTFDGTAFEDDERDDVNDELILWPTEEVSYWMPLPELPKEGE